MIRPALVILAALLATPALAEGWLDTAREHVEHAITRSSAPAFELPDPTVTPGQSDPTLSVAQLCDGSGTKKRRNVPSSAKAKVLRDYSTAAADSYAFEIDHLVPLCLGGTNAAENLWPQPEKEAAVKDRLERRLCDMVCAGQVPLATAQRAMADDWSAAYARYVGER